jgi:hypothetical protein
MCEGVDDLAQAKFGRLEDPGLRAYGRATSTSTATRAGRLIFLAVAVATCGGYAAVTMAPVIAHEITGSAFLAGLPVAVLLAGAGLGATRLAGAIRRWGYPVAFAAYYGLGVAGCLLAVVAVVGSSFVLLLVGVAGVGIGHAVNQLARYTAAELHPLERRASVIGWMIWALAIGAVVGPLTLGPAGRVAVAAGLAAPTGGFLVGAVLFGLGAAVHLLGPRPAVMREAAPTSPEATAEPASTWSLPTVQVAVAAMVTTLVVMLLVMTVTPVHVHSAGHGLAAVGLVMSAHTFGMFGLSPVAGKLTARFGSVPMIITGLGVLLLAVFLGAAAPATSRLLLTVALFALGFGWCLGFVAASTLLAQLPDAEIRAALQGQVEALTWISGAGAALASGLVLGWIAFPGVNLVAGALLVVPLAVIVRHQRAARLLPS